MSCSANRFAAFGLGWALAQLILAYAFAGGRDVGVVLVVVCGIVTMTFALLFSFVAFRNNKQVFSSGLYRLLSWGLVSLFFVNFAGSMVFSIMSVSRSRVMVVVALSISSFFAVLSARSCYGKILLAPLQESKGSESKERKKGSGKKGSSRKKGSSLDS